MYIVEMEDGTEKRIRNPDGPIQVVTSDLTIEFLDNDRTLLAFFPVSGLVSVVYVDDDEDDGR